MFKVEKILIRDNDSGKSNIFSFSGEKIQTDLKSTKESINFFYYNNLANQVNSDVAFEISLNNEKFLYLEKGEEFKKLNIKFENFKNGENICILKTRKGTYTIIDRIEDVPTKEQIRDDSIFGPYLFNEIINKLEKINFINSSEITSFKKYLINDTRKILVLNGDENKTFFNKLSMISNEIENTTFLYSDEIKIDHPFMKDFKITTIPNFKISPELMNNIKNEYSNIITEKILFKFEECVWEFDTWDNLDYNTFYFGYDFLDQDHEKYLILEKLNIKIFSEKNLLGDVNTNIFDVLFSILPNELFEIALNEVDKKRKESEYLIKIQNLNSKIENLEKQLKEIKLENTELKGVFQNLSNNFEDIEKLSKDEINFINEILQSKNEKMTIEKIFKSFGRDIKKLFNGQ